MAEAKEISGLDCQASAVDWATRVLQTRLTEVFELRTAAGDFSIIESVHDLRVSIRRLRSAVRDFLPLFKKRLWRPVRQDLKKFADALGAVRDEDVAIIAFNKLRADAGDAQIKEGIENLLTKRQILREQNRLRLVKIFNEKDAATLKKSFEKALERAVKNTDLTFNQAGQTAVGESLAHFLALSGSLYEPFDVLNLHELRIAAKRLRYALELFTACWGTAIKLFADEIAAMQAALGEVHDCDVWIEGTSDLLRRDNEASENERQAALWLLSEFTKRRTKHYRNALKLWSEWQKTDFAARMQAIINSIN